MDSYLCLPPNEQRTYCEQAAADLGLPAAEAQNRPPFPSARYYLRHLDKCDEYRLSRQRNEPTVIAELVEVF